MNRKTKISIIGGTGDQGLGLAMRWSRMGCPVIIGSRNRGRAESAATQVREQIGPAADVVGLENTEAVNASRIIVLSVPFAGQAEILKSIRGNFEAGDLVVDVTVPLETAVGGRVTRLLGVWSGSAAEQVQQGVPQGVDLVSAFHNVSAATLQDLEREIESDIIVCGNSAAAKQRVRPLIEMIKNCRFVDGGRLENSRIVESLTALLISLNIRYKTHHAGIRITGLPTS